jgi:hypothetical protein
LEKKIFFWKEGGGMVKRWYDETVVVTATAWRIQLDSDSEEDFSDMPPLKDAPPAQQQAFTDILAVD